MRRLIDADRLKEVFSRNVAGGNAYFDLIDNAPTVEAIPKDQYEARLKADMVAMLDKIRAEIADYQKEAFYSDDIVMTKRMVLAIIDKYKAESEEV